MGFERHVLAAGGQPGQVFARQPALRFLGGSAGILQALRQRGEYRGAHPVGFLLVQLCLDLQVHQKIHVFAQR